MTGWRENRKMKIKWYRKKADSWPHVSLKTSVIVGIVFLMIAGSVNAGVLEIKNDTTWGGIAWKMAALIRDDDDDMPFLQGPPGPALLIYPKNSQGDRLKGKGINSHNTSVVRLYLEATSDVPGGTNNSLRLRFVNSNMADYEGRNLTLQQDPNDENGDPNLYDVLDLTTWGTEYGYISLPDISNPVTGEVYANWIFRSDNYADLNLDAKVNLEDFAKFSLNWKRQDCDSNNHWCDFADLSRDGIVDYNDLGKFSAEWLYDTNDPNTW
jgi:hypothetical protein